MTSAAAAATRRAEIERKLAMIQMEREREANLLSQLTKQSSGAATSGADGGAAVTDALQALAPVESLVVFGATIKLGNRIKVQDDLSALRAAESCLKRKDPMTHVYLGEPGEVVTLAESYYGKPAVEMRFCDGSTHWYFAECLAVGERQPKLKTASQTAAIAARDEPKSPPKPAAPLHPRAQPAVLDPNAPVALPTSLPKRQSKPIAPRHDKPSAFDEELQLLMELSSNDSMGGPLTPGPARQSPTSQLHADPSDAVSMRAPRSATVATATAKAAPTAQRPTSTILAAKSAAAAKPHAAATAAPSAAEKRPAAATSLRPSTTKASPAPAPFARTDAAAPSAATYVDVSPSDEVPPPSKRPAATATVPSARVPPSGSSASSTSGVAKPMILKVYENGTYGDAVNERVPYKTVTVRSVHKSLNSVLTLTAQQLQWNADGRAVEVLYDAATGRPVPSLADLRDGMILVASTGDAFQPPRANSMLFADLSPAAQELHRASLAAKSRPLTARPAQTKAAAPRSAPTTDVAKPATTPVRGTTATARATALKRGGTTNVNAVLDEIKALESQLEFV